MAMLAYKGYMGTIEAMTALSLAVLLAFAT